MKQAAQYRQHAAECRKLALTAKMESERMSLMELAATWESLATQRERALSHRDSNQGTSE